MKKLLIETERLQIRNLKPSDVLGFHLYRSNPEVTKYQGFDVMDIAQAEKFIQGQTGKLFGKAGEWVQYGIENKKTGKLIGDCAIKLGSDDIRIAEIGITVSHTEQKNGYGKEALNGMLTFLFTIDGFHRIVGTADAENIASIHLLESTGFRQEGHFIENLFFKGKWGSEFQYAILKQEWELQKK